MTSQSQVLYRLAQPKSSGEDDARGFPLHPGQARISLHVKAGTQDADPYFDLCNGVTSYFDAKLDIFHVDHSCYESNMDDSHNSGQGRPGTSLDENWSSSHAKGNYPAFSIMVFLRSSDPDSKSTQSNVTVASSVASISREARARGLKAVLELCPWKLHHKERMKNSQGKINSFNADHHELFYTSSHLPLWGLRHVHYGREHIRFVLYTSHNSWSDQVQFYTLLLGLDPDLLREDFCLYTVQSDNEGDFDVQFSLKRLPESKTLCILDRFHLQVRVKDIGQLVPLFPNICRPLSDVIWQTTDHDGNCVFLDVVRVRQPVNSSNSCHRSNLSVEPTCVSNKLQNSRECVSDKDEGNTSVSYTCRAESKLYENEQHVEEILPTPESSSSSSSSSSFPSLSSREHATEYLSGDSAMTTEFDEENVNKNIDLCSIIHPSIFLFPPGSQTRGGSLPDEDEESLTLTNISEESGIQVFHDESTCGEIESQVEIIRPCLNKSGPKIRSTNRRVHFSDEIEAFEFEDDSLSRLSSGFESDDQSDLEIGETRFPAFTSSMNCSNIDSTIFSRNGPYPIQEQSGVKRSLDENQSNSRSSGEVYLNSKMNQHDNTLLYPPHKLNSSMSMQGSSSCHQDSNLHLSRPSVVAVSHSSSCEDVSFKRKPPSYEIATLRIAQLANKAISPSVSSSCPSSSGFATFGKHRGVENECATPSNASALSQPRQLKNLPRCATPLFPRETANQNSANVDDGSLSKEQALNLNQQQHHRHSNRRSNSYRMASCHSSITSSSTTPQLQEESKDLNLNLRFDTCPAPGGELRKEQIGFFV